MSSTPLTTPSGAMAAPPAIFSIVFVADPGLFASSSLSGASAGDEPQSGQFLFDFQFCRLRR